MFIITGTFSEKKIDSNEKNALSWNETKTHKSLVVTTEGNDYRIQFWFEAKSEALDGIKKADLSEKKGQLWCQIIPQRLWLNGKGTVKSD